MKQKNKGVDFLLKGTLGARLLENMSTGKGVSRADNGVHRAGRGGGGGGSIPLHPQTNENQKSK